MGAGITVEQFMQELINAEDILNTEFSFDLAEPSYLRCLEIVEKNPEFQPEFERCLLTLFESGQISDEPIAYLMHRLRWLGIKQRMEELLRSLSNPIAHGERVEKILLAYRDDWENRVFYSHL